MTVTAPVAQEVIEKGATYEIIISASGASSVSAYDDTTLLGACSDNGDGTWSYNWTPSSADMDINIRGLVDGAYTDSVQCVVSTVGIDQDISNWTTSGVTVTGGQSDPDGGSAAYLVEAPLGTNTQRRVTKAATYTAPENNSGFEVWYKPNNMNVLMIYPTGDGSDKYAYIDVTTGETRTRNAYAAVIETSGSWYRVWFQQINSSSSPPGTFNLYLCNAIGDNTPDTSAGDGGYLYEPTLIEGVPPLTDYQKLAIENTATVGGIETWSYTHPYNVDEGDVDLTTSELYILKPDGWENNGSQRVMWCLPALPQSTEDVAAIMDTGGYANTYGCVIAVPTVRQNFEGFTYWSEKNDGTFKCGPLLANALLPFVKDKIGGGSTKNHHGLIGYSKSAWGALSVLMIHNSLFGFVSVFDGNWDQAYGANGTTEQFGSEAQMDAFDPTLIASSYSDELSDITRVHFEGTAQFDSDIATIIAALNAASIPYSSSGTDYGSAINHVWDEAWVPNAVSELNSVMLFALSLPASGETNLMSFWKGAVEPAESSPSGNQIKLWKGAVEPAAPAASSAADALIGGVTRSVTRTLTRGVTEGWDWGA